METKYLMYITIGLLLFIAASNFEYYDEECHGNVREIKYEQTQNQKVGEKTSANRWQF